MMRTWIYVALMGSTILLLGCSSRQGIPADSAVFQLDRSHTVKAVDLLLPRYMEELNHALDREHEEIDRLQSEVAELARRTADWEMAFTHYRAVARRNTHSFYAEQAQHYLTLISEKQQVFVRLISVYENPSQAEAARAAALLKIAENYESLGAVEKAIEYWKRFVDEFPQHALAPDIQFRIGSAYFYSLYDYERGWPEFTKLIENEAFAGNPRRREAEKLLKQVKTALDGIKQDLDYLIKYHREKDQFGMERTQHPNRHVRYNVFWEQLTQTYLGIAKGWEENPLRNYPNAIAAYRELATELPFERSSAARAWFRAGYLYQKLKRYEMAIGCYESLLGEYRDAGWLDITLYQEAQCYEALHKLDMAHKRYREYLQLGPETDFFDEVMQHVQEVWGN